MSHAEPDTRLPQPTRGRHGDERGVSMRALDTLSDDSTLSAAAAAAVQDPDDDTDNTDNTSSSSPRNVRIPARRFDPDASASSSALQSLTSASTLSTIESKLDLSPRDSVARNGVLRQSLFDQWKDDAAAIDTDTPEEMQKKDPLGTQIWKLYHRTRGQLPNSERLENLTWRMMSMNLRRRELERKGSVVTFRLLSPFRLVFRSAVKDCR